VSDRTAGDFETGYRRVTLRGSKLGEDEWFLAAWFRFRPGDEKRARARIKELLAKRIGRAAARASECRLGISQPARRPRRRA